MNSPILVTGATGYVGGRLTPRLLQAGYRVRAMARSMDKIACRPWAEDPGLELVRGDMFDPDSLNRAVKGCEAVYYLVHSMIAQRGRYADADRRAARNMVAAASAANVKQIIYLGGLGDVSHQRISKHLVSRHEVGAILQSGPVPTTVLKAAMILGSGSASFEILRYLVERLPVMITPRWVVTPSQPIAIHNVLQYLIGCLDHPETRGKTFDIGGPEVRTYRELIDIFAQEAGFAKRRVFPVPVLTPRLSAHWIHLVTPVPSSIAVPLTEGLSVPTTCRENRIHEIIPQKLLSCREAIRIALERMHLEQVETDWTDSGELRPPEWADCGDAQWAGGTILECGYRIQIKADQSRAWRLVERIGGRNGYYFGDYLWFLRGLADRLLGGIGLRRGRRHRDRLYPGDALDFWRVLKVEPLRRLMLLAEMKLPGEALLDIQVERVSNAVVEIQLLSRFLPRGLWGIVYWYALYPFHQILFRGMLNNMACAIGEPRGKPQRFTPKIADACTLPWVSEQQSIQTNSKKEQL